MLSYKFLLIQGTQTTIFPPQNSLIGFKQTFQQSSLTNKYLTTQNIQVKRS